MLTCDHYMKCLTVRYNKITQPGIDKLFIGVSGHKDYVGFDIRDNPGFSIIINSPD
jgi:hypothetical protein